MTSPADQLREKMHSAISRLKENSHQISTTLKLAADTRYAQKQLDIKGSQTKAYWKQENLLAKNTRNSFRSSITLLRKTEERLEADLSCLAIQASVAEPSSY